MHSNDNFQIRITRPWSGVACLSLLPDAQPQMRAKPASDWRITDVERVCRQFNIRCVPRSSGSHYKISHSSQREIVTMPFRRPIRPVYIRKLVRFIDAVRIASAKA